MNRRTLAWTLVVLLAVGLAAAGLALAPRQKAEVEASLEGLSLPGGPFERAEGPAAFTFPKDFGPHEGFQTEWWYYTGNLATNDGQEFGFQLTFFRRALLGPGQGAERTSAWGTGQVYLAHFTLSEISRGRFHAFERFERGAAGLAGAQGEPRFSAWVDDWLVEQTGEKEFRLHAAENGVQIDLNLRDLKGPVLQGDRGYSRKGPEPGNASYYISQTRLETTGTLSVGGRDYAVGGLSWMDHEYSTSALGDGLVGWDWFSLQLDDGSELMVYRLRKADGSPGEYSQGTLIRPDGSVRPLTREDFSVEVNGTWQSPHSGGVYPAAWVVSVPDEGLTLRIRPKMADQELNLSFIYWEGAVRVEGERNGAPLGGSGYVELTGYAQSLAGRF